MYITNEYTLLPFEKVHENKWGSVSASLPIFWLGYSDFPFNKSQNCSDSAPSFCTLHCMLGCKMALEVNYQVTDQKKPKIMTLQWQGIQITFSCRTITITTYLHYSKLNSLINDENKGEHFSALFQIHFKQVSILNSFTQWNSVNNSIEIGKKNSIDFTKYQNRRKTSITTIKTFMISSCLSTSSWSSAVVRFPDHVNTEDPLCNL